MLARWALAAPERRVGRLGRGVDTLQSGSGRRPVDDPSYTRGCRREAGYRSGLVKCLRLRLILDIFGRRSPCLLTPLAPFWSHGTGQGRLADSHGEVRPSDPGAFEAGPDRGGVGLHLRCDRGLPAAAQPDDGSTSEVGGTGGETVKARGYPPPARSTRPSARHITERGPQSPSKGTRPAG